MDRPFMPKYSTVSQVLLQLVLASKLTHLRVDMRVTDLVSGSSEIDGGACLLFIYSLFKSPRTILSIQMEFE